MDLYHHSDPLFTQWVVDRRLIREPFTVIDAGCQGGPHPRWKFLRDCVDFHGFDPIREVIEELSADFADRKNYHYYAMGLGNEDGDRTFYVRSNLTNSSFYPFGEEAVSAEGGKSASDARTVSIRKLDTLHAEGCIPLADYIKLDCEGYESEVLLGAQRYLAASALLCASTETTFNISPTHQHSQFSTINNLLLPHRLVVFDFSFERAPHPFYVASLSDAQNALDKMRTLDVVGRPSTLDFVFCRDFVAERDWPQRYINQPLPYELPGIDKLIKAMMIFEMHGLMDCAVELAVQFRAHLEHRLDVSEALDLLLAPAPDPRPDRGGAA
jgi:FkbM family methyltransferase